jgi:hypothetical protein
MKKTAVSAQALALTAGGGGRDGPAHTDHGMADSAAVAVVCPEQACDGSHTSC